MGEDKALLPFPPFETLSQYQYYKLSSYFKKVYLSSKIAKFDFLKDNSSLIIDDGEIFSPIVALKTIIEKIPDKKFFLIPVDTPFISINSINKLIKESKNYDIIIPKTNKTHNLCGLFSPGIKTIVDKMLQKDIHKVGYLIKNSNSNIIQLQNNDEFLNLNNKEEYIKALKEKDFYEESYKKIIRDYRSRS